MNIPIILYGDDGTLLKSIETQHGRITVARTVQDFSEALGMAHTGIARVLLCARVPSEVSASIVDSLAQSEVLLAVVAPENLPLPTEVHRIRTDAALEEILGSIERAVDAALGRPRGMYGVHQTTLSAMPGNTLAVDPSGYGYDAAGQNAVGYGYDLGYGQADRSLPDSPGGAYGYNLGRRASSAEAGTDPYGYGVSAENDNAPSSSNPIDHNPEAPVSPSDEESVLARAAAIVDAIAPGSEYTRRVEEEIEDSLPQHPDITQNPEAPVRYQPGHRLGKILTVWGTHGAPGRSTIAFNLAALAAQKGQSVCLIDADTYAPSLDALMALEDAGSGLAIICSDADRAQLDEKKAGAIMERVPLKQGFFDFLSGITSASRWPEVRARAFSEVLGWLKPRYDIIICDVAASIEMDEELTFDGPAPRRNAATLTALAESDRVIVVGEADVVGLPRLINLAREVQERPDLIAPGASMQYWLNRSRREAAGFNPEAKMRDNWSRYLSVPLNGVIPYERKMMDRLRRNGEALLEVAPRHALVQAFDAMLEGMYAVQPVT
ncbi:CpaE family protein [uncultured Rothia sp.]|uniref:AAA family ATPase n=1 Tax=uncultured Rothia sp. TaxID=316088 RepID=UPI0025F99811|nr:P-loop NTPase [uncultured Rothia sp.]